MSLQFQETPFAVGPTSSAKSKQICASASKEERENWPQPDGDGYCVGTPGASNFLDGANIFKSPLGMRKNDSSPFRISQGFCASANKPGANLQPDLARAFLSEQKEPLKNSTVQNVPFTIGCSPTLGTPVKTLPDLCENKLFGGFVHSECKEITLRAP